MKYKLFIKTLLITVIAFFSVVLVQAQPASERPIPKVSVWMNKVEQNRSKVRKQLGGQRNAGMVPVISTPSSTPQQVLPPATYKPAQRVPAVKPAGAGGSQQPASGQKLRIPAKPQARDINVQKSERQ